MNYFQDCEFTACLSLRQPAVFPMLFGQPQGQFKKELPFDRAYTGQAYLRPFTQLPAKWLIRSAFSLIRRLSPALREDVTGDRPYMVSPLAATAQALRAEAPGETYVLG